MRLANSKNFYKFIAQTPEGQVAKYSDAIAYIASDLQDAFRMGFLTEFDEEYLEIIGTMISKSRKEQKVDKKFYTKEEKIKIAKGAIDNIQERKLREQFVDINDEKNKKLIQIARSISKKVEGIKASRRKELEKEIEELIEQLKKENATFTDQDIKELRQKHILEHPIITNEEIEQLVEQEVTQYKTGKPQKTSEGIAQLETDEEKIREFTRKFLTMRTTVVQAVTQQIQEYFINDILQESNLNKQGDNDMPTFSEEGLELLIQLKKKNMREFVIDTKWEYQLTEYPEAALKIVKKYAGILMRTGIIRNKFYDEYIRAMVDDKDALDCMKAHYYSERKRENTRAYKSKKGLQQIVFSQGQEYDGLIHNLHKYIEDEGESFATRYMHTYYAIPTRIEEKVKRALT